MYKIAINRMKLDGKLPKGDSRWEEFNTSFQNVELEMIDIANAIYCGHSYTAWHNGRRNTENFVCAQFIAVDMDTEDERSTIAYLANMEFVKVYGAFIYSTPSSTAATPRSRVIFLLDEPITNADAYKTAINFVYSLFPGSDPNCVKASGFFYGSKDCQIEIINNVLPVCHMRAYYQRWLKTQPKPAPIVATKSVEPVVYPQTAKTTTTTGKTQEQEVRDALNKINPWQISYTDWVKVLMALHHEYGDAGLPIAEQWGQGKDNEIKAKWRSFKANGNGNTVTLKTVFGMAKQH
jgi:hypothetical protein